MSKEKITIRFKASANLNRIVKESLLTVKEAVKELKEIVNSENK